MAGLTPEAVRDRVARAGIADRRPGGGGSVRSEPVLVSVRTGVTWGAGSKGEEIFDQDGKSLAIAKPRRIEGRWLGLRTRLGLVGVDLVDVYGRTVLALESDPPARPIRFTVLGADGHEIGSVIVAGGARGVVQRFDGASIAYLQRPPGGVIDAFRDCWYDLCDVNGVTLGGIAHQAGLGNFRSCNVAEIDGRVSDEIRDLVLAAIAAVHWWERPRGMAG